MNGIQAIRGGTLISAAGSQRLNVLAWDSSGRILPPEQAHPGDAPAFEAAGLLVCPGFINLHVHGGGGHGTMQATRQSLASIAAYQAAQGVTAFLPTTVTASPEALLNVAQAVKAYREDPAPGAEVLGLNLEGPYLAAGKTGAQNPAHLRPPDWEEFAAIQAASDGAVRLIGLAPELDPEASFIQRVTSTGVVVAAAHTNASYDDARHAIEHGLSLATHTFNAMSRFDYRAPRILEALLEDERVRLELIPDCTDVPHVHPVAIRLLRRMAGLDRLCTVTDAIAAAGMPAGIYDLGGLEVIKQGEIAYLREQWERDGTLSLAGSVLDMNRAVRNLVQQCGFSLAEAVQTASSNPARVLGLAGERGTLEPGKRADITILEPDTYQVRATIVGGQLVYHAEKAIKN